MNKKLVIRFNSPVVLTFALLSLGALVLDAVTAARAAMAATAKAPKDIGAVGQQKATVGEYYSQAQIDYYNDHPELLDKMSDAEFAKLCRSMSKH